MTLKNNIVTLFFLLAITTGCNSSKKTTSNTLNLSAAPESPKTGMMPGEAQLVAIKSKFPEVTMQNLNNGQALYVGKCTNCHGQKSIFSRTEEKWIGIVDKMAIKSNLTADEKDDLHKYILSLKATQMPDSK